jgi:hypothetical protein
VAENVVNNIKIITIIQRKRQLPIVPIFVGIWSTMEIFIFFIEHISITFYHTLQVAYIYSQKMLKYIYSFKY